LVPTFAPVIISKKRRRIINAFREAGATSSESAKSLEDISLSKSVLLEIHKLRGVIVKVEQNRFYLDEMQERKVERFRRILALVLVALIALIAWYFNKG
jgi:hypothetical protein